MPGGDPGMCVRLVQGLGRFWKGSWTKFRMRRDFPATLRGCCVLSHQQNGFGTPELSSISS